MALILILLFVVLPVLLLRKLGKLAAKTLPYVGVPLLLLGLLIIFPKLAPWFRSRVAAAVAAVKPEAE